MTPAPAPTRPGSLTRAEIRRKCAHMAAFWPALLLPWMTPLQALGVVFLLILMNVFILPWAAPGLYRAEETGLGALEIVLYPSALAACVAAFGMAADPLSPALAGPAGKPPWYLPVGAAWFALAWIDAANGFACRLLPRGPAFPWNPRKPILAVALGALASLVPAWALARLALPPLPLQDWLVLGGLVLFAALAETIWFGVADNVVIPFGVCMVISLVATPLAAGHRPGPAWPWVLVPAAFGILAYQGRMLTRGGAVLGALLALILILAEPWLFAFLGFFFASGNLATRFGLARKQARGLAEPRGGRRGAAEVFGAMGLAAWMTPLVHLAATPGGSGGPGRIAPALLVCIAPLIAKTMDTVSSEMGKALGGATFSLRTWRKVEPGSEGGVSLAGTAWGLAAAGIPAAAVVPLGWGRWTEAAALLAIAVAANIFESYWGEYAARRNLDPGAHTNILMTLCAAVLAWVLWFGAH